MRTFYTVEALEAAELCSGDEVQLASFQYATYPLDETILHATDPSGKTIVITHVPTSVHTIFSVGFFLDYVKVGKTSFGYRYIEENTDMGKCDCGAHHTITPKFHSSWCSTNTVDFNHLLALSSKYEILRETSRYESNTF